MMYEACGPLRGRLPVPRASEYIFGCGSREEQEGFMKIASLAALSALWLLVPHEAGAQAAQDAAGTADATAPVMAVWVEQKIDFTYVGFTSHYSCDGLKNKVSSILKEIGARPGFKVNARGCMNPRHGAEWTPMLNMVVAMPREATPEILAQVANDTARRELAAKAGGKTAPAAEPAAEFPARLRRIDFRDSPSGLVQPGDCELIEQLRDKVFVPLGAKVVESHMNCMPHKINIGIVNLSIDVLEPLPRD
jgi:hypothetical protein